MAGTRGPIGKSDEERVRRNEPVIETTTLTPDMLKEPVEIPAPDEDWHPIAQRLYTAAMHSPVAAIMWPTDWEYLYLHCEQISRELHPQYVGTEETWNSEAQAMETHAIIERVPMKGASLSAIQRGLGLLLVTIGDRRRMAIELKKESGAAGPLSGTAAGVTDINSWRSQQASS